MKKLYRYLNLRTGLFLFIVSFLMTACINHRPDDLSLFYNFDHNGPESGREYVFNPELSESDKDSVFNLNLIVRYTDQCRLETLPLKIEYPLFEDDSIVIKNIDIQLFNSGNDRTLGRGNFGVFESYVPILQNFTISQGFFIAISTVEKNTDGIISLGILCTPPETNPSIKNR